MPRRPTALHGVAATACAAYFFPDHRLSNSASNRGQISRLAALARDDGAADARRHPERSRGICTLPSLPAETRTPHLAHGAGGACRTAPIRWCEAMRYGASPRNPDPAPLCPASSDRYPNPLVLLNVTSDHGCFRSLRWLIRDQRAMPASVDHSAPVPTAPTGAHERPASRWSPACRGRSMQSRVSVVMRSSVREDRRRVAAVNPETRNRAADDRPTGTAVGVGPTHTPVAWCIDS
jgi:hypothetical protein